MLPEPEVCFNCQDPVTEEEGPLTAYGRICKDCLGLMPDDEYLAMKIMGELLIDLMETEPDLCEEWLNVQA